MRRPGPSPYQRYVHQRSDGRWVVAVWISGQQYHAPLTETEYAKKPKAHMWAETVDGLVDVPSYANSEGAFRRAHRLWDTKEDAS